MARKSNPAKARKPRPHQNPMRGMSEVGPLAVPDLAVAARLLGQPLDRVKEAATRCRPYLGGNGRTEFHSLAQLARALGLPMGSANPTSGTASGAPTDRARHRNQVGKRQYPQRVAGGTAVL